MDTPMKSTSIDCEGCFTKQFGDSCCEHLNPRGICPCTNCLVKPTCNHECKDYSYFVGLLDLLDLDYIKADHETLERMLYDLYTNRT
jgi:hypothetical protein